MGIERFHGELMVEPLLMRPWEIAELTDEQILMAVAASARRQKDNRGEPTYFDADGAPLEEQFEMHAALGRTLGLPESEIIAQWNATHPGNVRSPVGTGFPPVSPPNASNATLGEGNGVSGDRRSIFKSKGETA